MKSSSTEVATIAKTVEITTALYQAMASTQPTINSGSCTAPDCTCCTKGGHK